MEVKNDSKSISVCENSSGSVLEAVIIVNVEGQSSESVSKKILAEEQVEEKEEEEEEEEDVNKPQQGKENDSRIAKDGVGCSNIPKTHAVQEEIVDNVSAVRRQEAECDTSKGKAKEESHVVDLSGIGGERICRICHFGSDQSPEVSSKSVSSDLIEIGCKCKNDLGLAHYHCAEAWFKLKGNSVCEICGSTAKNVTVTLMEEWSEVRDDTLDARRRRGRGQSCCIFMIFLLTILLLHWFFKKISGYYNQNT